MLDHRDRCKPTWASDTPSIVCKLNVPDRPAKVTADARPNGLLWGLARTAIIKDGRNVQRGDSAMSTPTPGGSNLFKVASTSNPASVAGAIAGTIREKGRCEMQAIGAGA